MNDNNLYSGGILTEVIFRQTLTILIWSSGDTVQKEIKYIDNVFYKNFNHLL